MISEFCNKPTVCCFGGTLSKKAMHLLHAWWLSHQKLIGPSLLMAVATLGLEGLVSNMNFSLQTGLMAYAFFLLAFHGYYSTYQHKQERYFYENVGLGRRALWAATLGVSFSCFMVALWI